MELRIIEAIVYAAAGCLLIVSGLMIQRRITRMKFFAFVYAGILFLLAALATLLGWIRFGASMNEFDFYARLAGACFFLYLAFVQSRKHPRSIVWILYLIGGIGIVLTAIFRI